MDNIPLISDKQKDVIEKNRFYKKPSKIDKIKLSPTVNNGMKKKKRTNILKKARAAIYIGHIPHGFYENEMTEYFNQFGKVHSAVVIRSKKTGRSRGYGFVEFEDEEVAKIAAESMNNYLIFNRVLKCRYIAPEERNKLASFRSAYSELPKVKNRILDSKNKRKALQGLNQSSYQKKAQKKIDDFKKFFKERGIDFSFKVNFAKPEENKTDESNNVESSISRGSESEDDADDQFGVLEIDESDNEIHFKTPPQVKKVIKRSSTSTTASSARSIIQLQEERQGKKPKNSVASEIKKSKGPERKKLSNGVGRKLEKGTKTREKPLLKSFKPKKAQNKKVKAAKKNNATTIGRKKGKAKGKKRVENKQG